MTRLRSYIEWATRPPEFGPWYIKANALILGPIVLVIAGLIWLVWG